MAKVLIVDDALYMRNKIHKVVVKMGLDVVGQATDGFDAIDKFKQFRPDIVTLDITMPFMSGIEVLQRIKVEAPDTIVIIIAANGAEQSVKEAVLSGANNFVMKPFEDDVLEEIIKNCMRGRVL